MRSSFLTTIIIGIISPIAPILSLSATLHVEKDGSGDYTVIQEAVDAAASGDTIMIGPGQYNEGQLVTFPSFTLSLPNIPSPEFDCRFRVSWNANVI